MTLALAPVPRQLPATLHVHCGWAVLARNRSVPDAFGGHRLVHLAGGDVLIMASSVALNRSRMPHRPHKCGLVSAQFLKTKSCMKWC
jgi:hypothetical protein